jgi:hypothetical protein
VIQGLMTPSGKGMNCVSNAHPAPQWFRWIAIGFLLIAGCGRDLSDAPVIEATLASPVEPSEIELSNPKAVFEAPDVVRLEVTYRFVKGEPRNFYCAQVEFPGTENVGMKYMEGWELESSGVLKSGLILKTVDVKDFTVQITEALLPQNGYKPISNVVKAQVDGLDGIAAAPQP